MLKVYLEVVFFREMMEIINGNVFVEMLGVIFLIFVLFSVVMMFILRIFLYVWFVSWW